MAESTIESSIIFSYTYENTRDNNIIIFMFDVCIVKREKIVYTDVYTEKR
jgi:hypothetical protein